MAPPVGSSSNAISHDWAFFHRIYFPRLSQAIGNRDFPHAVPHFAQSEMSSDQSRSHILCEFSSREGRRGPQGWGVR